MFVCQLLKRTVYGIKLNINVEDTKVSLPFTKPNAVKGVLSEIIISEILFRFLAE